MRSRSSAAAVTLVVATVVLLAAVLLGALVLRDAGPAGLPVPADAADAPLRMPPDVADPGGYAFLAARPDGTPVSWDPCRPVHVVVRPQGEPAGGRAAVTAALEEVGAAAGLVFVVDGETDEAPDDERAVVDRARYGARWSPVLVTWSDTAEHPALAGALGRAGPARSLDDPGTWVSGSVVLDAAWFAGSLPDEIGRRRAEAVLVHELSHLVGLDHSSDPFSLMSPTYQSVFDLSLSDRAGLARLGGGRCSA